MAKVMVINGIRCIPENRNALSADKRTAERTASELRAAERFELQKLILEHKVAEILASI